MQSESVLTVQHNCSMAVKHQLQPIVIQHIRNWLISSKETDSVLKGKSPGSLKTSEATVEQICASFVHSPIKSLARRSLQLGLPKGTVYNV